MPTLEDTVDFKVATLNDLLDADVRTGVPVAADDKYKRWAFLSSALAGMLLVALIVSLVTGGGDSGGTTSKAGKSIAAPANTGPVDVSVGSQVPTGIELNAIVSVLDADGKVIASGETVTQIKEVPNRVGKGSTFTAVLAVNNDELPAVNTARATGKISIAVGRLPKPTSSTAPAASTTPTPIEPAPATTPTS